MDDCIICDIDGTLALRKNRGPFDWAKVGQDEVNQVIADIVTVYHNDAKVAVILVSGRDSVCRPETEQWLAENNIPYTELLMRPEGDHRKDTIVKVELYKKHIKGQYKVRFVLDDRNQMVQAWRRQKLTCLQVAEGDF
jgi:hypothetical protein